MIQIHNIYLVLCGLKQCVNSNVGHHLPNATHMRVSLLLILISFFLYSCSDYANHDLKIPDKVQPGRKASSQQLPGTRIFVIPPEKYQLVQQLIRFQKNDSTFLQAYEIPGSSFDLQQLKAQFEQNRKSGKLAKEYYQKELQFGTYDAVFIYGPGNIPNREQMLLAFGDRNFSIMAVGELPSNDRIAREELVKALLTVYVDTAIIADPSALATYSLNVSGTDFEYVGNVSQSYFYNYRGKPLDNADEFANQIFVSTLPAQTHQALKEFGQSMIERYRTNGMVIPKYAEREFTLNGNYAYEIKWEGNYKGRKNSVYQIVTTNGTTSSALFLGSAYDDIQTLMEQIKQAASTLRLK